MGREIRMVPPNWEHPRREDGHHQPLYDRDVQTAFAEWMDEYTAFLGGEHDRIIAEYGAEDYPKDEPYRAFCEWHGEPPDPKYHRPAWPDGSATWFQVYQTVSEGSPVTPPFATKEELVDYLVANGDFWDQDRAKEPKRPWDGDRYANGPGWSREAVESFVGMGHAPSLVVCDGKVYEARDGFPK